MGSSFLCSKYLHCQRVGNRFLSVQIFLRVCKYQVNTTRHIWPLLFYKSILSAISVLYNNEWKNKFLFLGKYKATMETRIRVLSKLLGTKRIPKYKTSYWRWKRTTIVNKAEEFLQYGGQTYYIIAGRRRPFPFFSPS